MSSEGRRGLVGGSTRRPDSKLLLAAFLLAACNPAASAPHEATGTAGGSGPASSTSGASLGAVAPNGGSATTGSIGSAGDSSASTGGATTGGAGGSVPNGGDAPSAPGSLGGSVAGTATGGAGGATTGGAATLGESAGGTASSGVGGALASDGGAGGSAEPTNGGELLAFPGAEGFGRLATGARGGDVHHVTTLNDSGPGSLRDAISAPNRTVIFDVSGVIKLETRLVFLENQTIAGQTAPGGGVVVYGNGTSFTNAHNAIVRYMRFRMGKIGDSEKDTIAIARGHDMIFDHCSLSWSRDGTFDLNQESGYELGNITLQDSIVAQGLQTHSTGGLLNAAGVSVLRSLYIDNNSRNPKARQTTQWVNNIDYNWVASGYILGDTTGRSDGYLVGNYFIPGPETGGGTLDSPTSSYHVFANGNYYDDDRDGTLGGRLLGQGDFGSVTWEEAPSVDFPPVTEMSAAEAFDYVVERAGASLWRDEVDDYVIAELLSLGTSGTTISDETSLGLSDVVGQFPSGTAPVDTDQDGMPDAWEEAEGLSTADPTDRNGDPDGDGYTHLEDYLNSLVP